MARPKSPQSLATRDAIVKTAKDLFMTLGYRAVSTRQIAEACGLTQPALYHHFADKQSLYVEVLRRVCENTSGSLGRIIHEEATVDEQLFSVTCYMLMNHREDLNRMLQDIRHELTTESQRSIYVMWRTAYLAPIVTIFEQGQLSGELRSPARFGIDAETSARLLMGMISQAISARAAVTPLPEQAMPAVRPPASDAISFERQARMLVDVLLYGLSAADPPSD